MYLYPKNISEFKEKDIYEIKHWALDEWAGKLEFSRSDCHSRKTYIKYLILNNRIRIKK